MIIVIENNLQTVQNESTPDKNDSLYILGALMVLGWKGGGSTGGLVAFLLSLKYQISNCSNIRKVSKYGKFSEEFS